MKFFRKSSSHEKPEKKQKLTIGCIFWHSLRMKAIIILCATILLACILTVTVMYISLRGRISQEALRKVSESGALVSVLLERSDLSADEIVEAAKPRAGRIYLTQSLEKVGVILEEKIAEEQMTINKLYFGSYHDPHIVGVFNTGDMFLVLEPIDYNYETAVAKAVILHTILLFGGISAFCTLITLSHAIRPLHKLDHAISLVGQGNFDVSVNYRGNDEIGKIVRNFNWMTGELKNIEYLRRDFISNVSHEFKTPIAAVQGSAKLLASIPREKLSDEKLRKYTGLILDETARMSELSSNLLRLSRLENQSVAENIVSFSLDEQIRRCMLLLENQWSTKHMDLDIQLDPVTFRGDEELLQQVWINLLSNAVKFTEPGGSISIKLRAGEAARVEISDSGSGMSNETMERMFEKFYQGDVSRSREGSGLGLSIVKRILDLHHAEITYKSALDEGTLCIVILPMIK